MLANDIRKPNMDANIDENMDTHIRCFRKNRKLRNVRKLLNEFLAVFGEFQQIRDGF